MNKYTKKQYEYVGKVTLALGKEKPKAFDLILMVLMDNEKNGVVNNLSVNDINNIAKVSYTTGQKTIAALEKIGAVTRIQAGSSKPTITLNYDFDIYEGKEE